MSEPIRVLMVEDSEDDALLVLRELRRGGYEPFYKILQEKELFLNALSEPWDLILCDYILPSFDAMEALKIYHQNGSEIPFIVVSGNIGEEIAVAAMKAGAHDYIMKDNLARLVPAVERELREAGERASRKKTEKELKLAKFAIDHASDAIAWVDERGKIFYVNETVCSLLGCTREEMIGRNVSTLGYPEDPEEDWEDFVARLKMKGSLVQEANVHAIDGRFLMLEATTNYLEYQEQKYICAFARDISERKNAEIAQQELAKERNRLLEWMQLILTRMPFGCILADSDFRFIYWNPAAEKLFGYTSDEIQGRLPYETIAPPHVESMVRGVQRQIENGDMTSHGIYENVTKDGRVILCEWHNTALKNPEGEYIGTLSMVQNITDKKESEEAILRHSARVEALLRTAAHLNSMLELQTILNAVCEEAYMALNAISVTVSLFDQQDEILRRVTGIGPLAEYGRPESSNVPLSVFADMLKKPIKLIADIHSLSNLPNMNIVDEYGIKSAAFVSIICNGVYIGCLNVFFQGERSFKSDEIMFLQGLVDQTALAITNARLFEEIKSGQEQMRKLNAQVVTAQEEERRRISRELHDEAGQALTALKIYLELIYSDLPEEMVSIRSRVDEAAVLAGATLEQIRLLAQDLRPPALETLGINLTLEHYCQEFSKRVQIPIDYQGADLPAGHDAQNICLYRVLQEALTNAAKHARAKRIRVGLRLDNDTAELSIQDDGRGFAEEETRNGHGKGVGLLGMRERIEALDGTLAINSGHRQGTVLIARIPWEGM